MNSRQQGDPGEAIATAGLDDGPGRTVDVGLLIAHSPGGDPASLAAFADRMATDAADELAGATDAGWSFHGEPPEQLPDRSRRRPSSFLDQATHRMVDGPYDVVAVVTDVPLISSRNRFVPGLASPLSRVVVVSTATLARTHGGEPRPPLDAPAVRWNAATLLLHLVGHVLGARHRDAAGGIMEPFRFDPDRRSVPPFDATVKRYLRHVAHEVPQAEAPTRSTVGRAAFYVASAVRNPGQILRSLIQSRAPLLPLSLPTLATAAVAPTLVIVFSAEAWDVGFHMSNGTAAFFAVVSILAATLYLVFSQNLSFPRTRHGLLTEHTALVNVAVFFILLLAMVGLFVLVGTIILIIELVVFPPNLMSNWPSLENPSVGLADLVRTASFISTIGVLSGALGGGLESRTILRHLTLFLDGP